MRDLAGALFEVDEQGGDGIGDDGGLGGEDAVAADVAAADAEGFGEI